MSWRRTFSIHGHKYIIEGMLMAAFMCVLAVAGTVIEHPDFPICSLITHPWMRRALMGVVAGTSLVGLIYSPWGRESGAHLNPAITLAYWQLGKLGYRSASAYIVAQCIGAVAGVALGAWFMGSAIEHPSVRYVATEPGDPGLLAAFVAEWTLSFLLMLVVRMTTLSENWAKRTGLCVGLFVGFFVCVESPISGMSLNPARTLASSVLAHQAHGLWIYMLAPPLGMLCAAQLLRIVGNILGQPTRWVLERVETTGKALLFRRPPRD